MIVMVYLFTLSLYAWAVLNPIAARTVVAELMRRRRRYLIRRYGTRSANRLFLEFRRRALRQGLDPGLVDTIILEYRPFVTERLGTQIANVRLGKTTPLERNF